MKTVRNHIKLGLVPLCMAFIITTMAPGFQTEARAFSGASFVGGMMAGHIVGGAVRRSRMRTVAMMDMAYKQPRSQSVYVQQPAATYQQVPAHSHPAQTAQPSVEERLRKLDNLANKGYITPQEYKAKKQAILDSL
jgi:hypothetical protein